MDGRDQGTSGDEPDDRGEDLDGGGLRGWISPDDRLWRHPSESGAAGGLSSTAWKGADWGGRKRSGTWIIGGATACVVVALVAAGVIMVATGTAEQGSSDTTPGNATLTGAPTTNPGLVRMAGSSAIEAMVSSIRPSTVALKIDGPSGTATVTGLVAESGGIIVTMSELLSGARSILAVEPDGTRQAADLVGVDRTSGLAVVRIADDLPAATFDADDPTVGEVAVVAALAPSHSDAMPASSVYAGPVVSAGQALGADSVTTAFSATAVQAPLRSGDLGCLLLDSSGHVSGMLEMVRGSGPSTMAVFLPAELVIGVARQLVISGTVEHGWLGVESSDAAPTTTTPIGGVVTASSGADGARLDSVVSYSPAADAGLVPGDVITAIDGSRVQSTAELRSRLYADPPGSSLSLTIQRGSSTLTTSVVLAEPDTAAPGDDSSS